MKLKVALGERPTESKAIRYGVPVLTVRNRSVESWLCGEVAETYDALKLDRSKVVSIEKVRARLAAAHGRATSAPQT